MKKIGIIVADKNEIFTFPWVLKEVKKILQFSFLVFTNGVVVVHSGIGIANAASATQQLITTFKVNQIWNYGAVGGSSKMKLFDLVTPGKIFYHDIQTPWFPIGQTPGERQFYVNNLEGGLTNYLASGSSFISDIKYLNKIQEKLNVDIFDMEAAAIAQIASKNNIKLFVVKCVSDQIGIKQKDRSQINDQIKKAGQKAFNYTLAKISEQEKGVKDV